MEHAILKATDLKEGTPEFIQLQKVLTDYLQYQASDKILKTFMEGYDNTLIAFLNHLNQKVFDVPIEINSETQEIFHTDIVCFYIFISTFKQNSEEEELNEKILNAQKELQSVLTNTYIIIGDSYAINIQN